MEINSNPLVDLKRRGEIMETTNKYINLDEAQSETVKLNTQAGELETAIKETHYIPSQHAAERFAERVWGCTTTREN